ncbi:MAG: 50S ribosomal protein L27 [Candidatus Pacebacteria bacterium]|nr:50S ribosomal protein L27 [Candidatus Paceibacterota bacterium]
MAHTKSAGSTRLGRDSRSKRLGVKKFDGQIVKSGNVLIRQRGTKWHPGLNTKLGCDDTIYALTNGVIKFSSKRRKTFTGKTKRVSLINVIPSVQKQ